jgi:uncharacterized membrane protein
MNLGVMRVRPLKHRIGGCAIAAAMTSTAGAGPQFHLVTFDSSYHESAIVGLSTDGSVACGFAKRDGAYVAIRWTAIGGALQILNADGDTFATAISADGSTIVGLPSFLWHDDDDVSDLPPSPAGSVFSPFAMSADAAVVAGFGLTQHGMRALRWHCEDDDGGEVESLGVLGEDFTSDARGISADGQWITGYSSGASGPRAILWSSEIGLVGLGVPEGWDGSVGRALSGDGSVVVGSLTAVDSMQGFRWTATDGFEAIPLHAGSTASEVTCTSADGELLGGTAQTADGPRAIIWTRAGATIDLNDYFRSTGFDLGGWTLTNCHAISPDGTAIAGDAVIDGVASPVGFVITGLDSMCLPTILEQPEDVFACHFTPVTLDVVTAWPAATYAWRRDGVVMDPLVVPSAASPSLELGTIDPEEAGSYDVVITNDCGSLTSTPALVSVCHADFDCSGFVDLDDFSAFTAAFEVGDDNADFDGSGFVDTDDFGAFAAAFDAGC